MLFRVSLLDRVARHEVLDQSFAIIATDTLAFVVDLVRVKIELLLLRLQALGLIAQHVLVGFPSV